MRETYVPFPELFVNRMKRTKPFDMPVLHYHDGYEFFYVIDGERDFLLNDTEYRLKKGDALLMKPFELHFSFSSPSEPMSDRYAVNFKPEQLSEILDENEFKEIDNIMNRRMLHMNAEQQRYILRLLTMTDNDNADGSPFAKKAAKAGIVQLFALLRFTQTVSAESGENNAVLKAIKYINENYRYDITLSDISDFCYLNPSYFCRKFKSVTGITFLQYLSDVRVNNAHRLLTSTDKSIREIADECGFSSLAHMTRLFNKSYNTPPSKINRKRV
ncbi:MAG: AraC family transcriptional regulator [Oscillospiraceae bacterium]|nr:AraC family transcriptional regulator [Oscillospiraceae bacterium]